MSSPKPASPWRESAIDLWSLLALTVGGAVLRFYHLGLKSLWYDEAATYHMVQGGWPDILAQNASFNSAPPLYALILGLSTGPEASEAILRLPGALASVLVIPLCFVLVREFTASRAALLAPLLAACSPTQIIYAQQLREYSLTVCLTTLLLIAFARFIRAPDARPALWVAVAAVVGVATQYGVGLVLAGLNLVCLVALRRSADPRRAYGRWFLAQLPAAAVAAVLVWTVLSTQIGVVALGRTSYLAANFWDGTAHGLWSLLTAPANNLVNYAFPGYLMLALTVAGALAFLFRAGSGLASAFLLVPTLLVFACAVAGIYPYGAIRQVIFLTPMIYVSAALGLAAITAAIARGRPAAVGFGAAVAISTLMVVPGLRDSVEFLRRPEGIEPMRPVAEALAREVQPGDTIYVYWGSIPAFGYYWRDRPEPWLRGAVHWSGMNEDRALGQMQDVQTELSALIARGRPFWLVLSHIQDPDANLLFAFLERSANGRVAVGVPGVRLLQVIPRPGQ